MTKVAIFTLDGFKWDMSGVFTKDAAEMELRHLKNLNSQTRAFPLKDTVDILGQLEKLEASLNAHPQFLH